MAGFRSSSLAVLAGLMATASTVLAGPLPLPHSTAAATATVHIGTSVLRIQVRHGTDRAVSCQRHDVLPARRLRACDMPRTQDSRLDGIDAIPWPRSPIQTPLPNTGGAGSGAHGANIACSGRDAGAALRAGAVAGFAAGSAPRSLLPMLHHLSAFTGRRRHRRVLPARIPRSRTRLGIRARTQGRLQASPGRSGPDGMAHQANANASARVYRLVLVCSRLWQ